MAWPYDDGQCCSGQTINIDIFRFSCIPYCRQLAAFMQRMCPYLSAHADINHLLHL